MFLLEKVLNLVALPQPLRIHCNRNLQHSQIISLHKYYNQQFKITTPSWHMHNPHFRQLSLLHIFNQAVVLSLLKLYQQCD